MTCSFHPRDVLLQRTEPKFNYCMVLHRLGRVKGS